MTMKTVLFTLAALVFTPFLVWAGILTVGPDYHAPTNQPPAAYKEVEHGNWKEGRPLDTVAKGNWWEIFGDPMLNSLEDRALRENQSLKASVARVQQARAVARVARADLLPSLSLAPSYSRQRYSENQVPGFGGVTADTFSTPVDLSYEVDLWGRVRRGFESARSEAQASLADHYNVLLALQADVAQNYFKLRALDLEIGQLEATVGLRHEQVRLVRSRLEGGIGNELDIARAETELATTQSETAALARQRSELENALAILLGENPSVFKLSSVANWSPMPPNVPAGLPSDLLERRPDVSQAERRLAAANARIGVAKAAFFPVLSLTASGGYLSAEAETLFNWSSHTWSLGPSLSLPIFSGGRNKANYRRSQAAFAEQAAVFREQVLRAFGDVENSLAAIRYLSEQFTAQERATSHSQRAADFATQRYQSGIVGYLEVVDANREALQAQRGSARLVGQRLNATVQLIKALGGGWETHLLVTSTKSKKRT